MNKKAMQLNQVFPKKLLESKAGKKILVEFLRGLKKLPASNYSKRIIKHHAELLPGLAILGPTPWPSNATAIFGLPYYAGIKNAIKELAKGKATKALKALPKEQALYAKALKKAPLNFKDPTQAGFFATMLGGPILTDVAMKEIKKKKKKKKPHKKKSSLSQPEVIKLAAAIVIKNHPNFSPLTRPF